MHTLLFAMPMYFPYFVVGPSLRPRVCSFHPFLVSIGRSVALLLRRSLGQLVRQSIAGVWWGRWVVMLNKKVCLASVLAIWVVLKESGGRWAVVLDCRVYLAFE